MQMQFTIEDHGFRKRLERTKTLLPNRIKEAVKKGTVLMLRKSQDTAPTAFGDLKKSISADVQGFAGRVRPTVQYAVYVHEGTRPHWMPSREWKPGGSLFKWATRKGIPPFLVARAIARRGTKARPWMRRAYEANQSRLMEYFQEAVDGTVENLAK